MHYCTQCLQSCSRPLPIHTSTRDFWRLLNTPGHVWVSFLCGQLLLSPGVWWAQGFLVPSKSLFPQSSASSGGSMVGLMVTSSKRTYAIPRSAAPRDPAAGHCWPYLHRRHSDTVRAQSLWVGCVSCALLGSEPLRWPGAWWGHCPRWTGHLNHLPGASRSVSQVCHESTISGVLYVSSGGADLRLRPSWCMSTIQDLRKTWLAAGSLLTVWWKMPSLGLRL